MLSDDLWSLMNSTHNLGGDDTHESGLLDHSLIHSAVSFSRSQIYIPGTRIYAFRN